MRPKTIWILISCMLVIACEKRKYPEEKIKLEEEEIFCHGSIGGQSVDLTIGKDGYYCYSSHKQRPDSVYLFQGDLRKFDCNPCPSSFRVELSDYRKRAPGTPVIADSSFHPGSRKIIPAFSKISTLKLGSYSNKNVSAVQWHLSDGTISPDPHMNFEFAEPGLHTVSLTVRTIGNCENTIINKIFVGGTSGILACSISSGTLPTVSAQFSANIIGGKPPYSYTWSFGDGTTTVSATPTHVYKYGGSYPVKLIVKDDENNICESNYIHVAGNDLSSCALNMSVSHVSSRTAALNGVVVQWTDQSNVIYRSDLIAQPEGSYFEILGSKEYEPNEKGEAARLLDLRFNILLANGNRTLWFKSDKASIAVSYK